MSRAAEELVVRGLNEHGVDDHGLDAPLRREMLYRVLGAVDVLYIRGPGVPTDEAREAKLLSEAVTEARLRFGNFSHSELVAVYSLEQHEQFQEEMARYKAGR